MNRITSPVGSPLKKNSMVVVLVAQNILFTLFLVKKNMLAWIGILHPIPLVTLPLKIKMYLGIFVILRLLRETRLIIELADFMKISLETPATRFFYVLAAV